MRKSVLVIAYIIGLSLTGFSQSDDIYKRYNIYRNPARVFLNKFSFTLTSGYALTNYSHSLEGFYFYQDNNQQLILDNSNELGELFVGYNGWMSYPFLSEEITIDDPFDVPYDYLENPVNNPLLRNRQILVDADTLELGFNSYSPTVPVMLAIDYDIKRFRIGAGFQYERHYIKPLRPSILGDRIRPYVPKFEKTSYFKYFGLLGYQFYDWWDYSFVAELQLGRANAGKEINQDAIGIGQKFFANIGINIEKNLSEYFRVVVRPSYDIKSYVVNLPDASSLRHYNHAFMVQVGVSINIPEIPRSPQKSDHVQLKHVIVDPSTGRLMEVRGQPFWKKQNPKVGENHRRLWRYKLKNRRKIDPY
ncbi:MAG: hypothetical protein CMB80_33840 [Flammeovirgaceae bacterium]|nr:hypothetical protein [Flammeovirgaceae bacterium]MBE61534.1 hypothetical protein [Flammeovirgaceae bacterium]MBR08893.1 hypothetical protein [Rickettsiales bacterium]